MKITKWHLISKLLYRKVAQMIKLMPLMDSLDFSTPKSYITLICYCGENTHNWHSKIAIVTYILVYARWGISLNGNFQIWTWPNLDTS